MRLLSDALRAAGVPHGFVTPREGIPEPIVLPEQVHGARVVHAARLADRPADGAWFDRRGLTLAVRTADCVPVLLYGPGQVAAIHAGWRGVAAGIVERFVAARMRRGVAPSTWIAALGPAADGCCYEVGPEVAAALDLPPQRGCVDLRALLASRLSALGVARVERVGPCTMCGDGGWASYRRQGAAAGRNYAYVALPG